jgi:prenyltransferase beta subunit
MVSYRTYLHCALGAVLATCLLLGLLVSLPPVKAADTQAISRADVVVQLGDGQIVTRRITFTGAISGAEALRRTGLPLALSQSSAGVGVCRIGATGCPADDCFCACPPPFQPCLFWEYNQLKNGVWASSQVGAGASILIDGAVEGWAWGRSLPAVTPPTLAAHAGLQWLTARQAADGGFGSVGGTIDAILASRAVGEFTGTQRRAVNYLRNNGQEYAAVNTASLGKLTLGLAAANQDPRQFFANDLVLSLTTRLNPVTGAYGITNWDQSLAILGLRAAGEPVPVTATQRLLSRANPDGGWGFGIGDSDVDSTALAVQALIAAGTSPTSTAVLSAVQYLDTLQQSDGGFPYQPGVSAASNVNSTAFAVQALLAAGEDPLKTRWQPAASNPISYLLALQFADGAWPFANQPSQLATAQAIPAMLGKPFPYRSTAVSTRQALAFIRTQQLADGSFAGGFGSVIDAAMGPTVDAILAIRAAGGDPQQFVSSEGKRPLDYLARFAARYADRNAASAGKLLTGVVAAGGNPYAFGGTNLVISTTIFYNPNLGAYGTNALDQAWSMIGLRAAGQNVPDKALERLRQLQQTDGGWIGFEGSDVDTTALALRAFAAATSTDITMLATCLQADDPTAASVRRGLAFLRNIQNGDGGFPYQRGQFGTSTSNSTGAALQALAALGETPISLNWTIAITNGTVSRLTQNNPLDYLLAAQSPAGGFAGFSGPNDVFSTYQALYGVTGRSGPFGRQQLVWMPGIRR